jgi:hypothetical protein
MESANERGGCLKVLAIAVPIIALAAFLLWKVSQASGRAEAASERVVRPYLTHVQSGEYQKALEGYATPSFRDRVSAVQLKAAYAELTSRHGKLVGFELTIAQEQHAIGEPSIVRANYTLKFEKNEAHVTYDILGEGETARIDVAYERPPGPDILVPSPR